MTLRSADFSGMTAETQAAKERTRKLSTEERQPKELEKILVNYV